MIGQILDAIRVAHETLHSIKTKKIKSLVLKLDMMKAYDRVDWGFLMDWCCYRLGSTWKLLTGSWDVSGQQISLFW
jgi:hypothetical protein